eukprot:g474.t1
MRKPIDLANFFEAADAVSANRGKPVSDLKLLDVGCGTGNYLRAVSPKLGDCVGLEYNEGMLEQAQAKEMPGVELSQGTALDLTRFKPGSFDLVIMTQVLHHLEPEVHRHVLEQISRVIAPGGAFWMSTQTPHQHMDGFWWTPLIPKASAKVAARFSGLPELTRTMSEAGFASCGSHVPAETLISPPHYLVRDGPFDEIFRNCDSTWSAATDDELQSGLDWWRGMIDSGSADTFLEGREKLRALVGMTTSVTAVKSIGASA